MEHSGSAEHGMKQQGVMGVGWWALRRVCGLGGPQGGRTRDAQGRRCGGIAPWGNTAKTITIPGERAGQIKGV